MGLGFKKFKRRLLLSALVKCIAACLGAAALAAAVVTAVLRLTDVSSAISPGPMYLVCCIGCGAVALLIGGAVLYPTDKRTARRLDSALELGEMTQTMLEYRDDEGLVAAMQRDDTDRRLRESPLSVVGTAGKRIIAFAVTIAVCAGLLVGSLLIPIAADSGDLDDVTEEPSIDEANKQRIINILNDIAYRLENPSNEQSPYFDDSLQIRQIDITEMDATLRESAIARLRALAEEIADMDKLSAMKRAAVAMVQATSSDYQTKNTYSAIGGAFAASGMLLVADFGTKLADLNRRGSADALENIVSDAQSLISGGNTGGAVVYADEIAAALNASGAGYEDPLRSCLSVIEAAIRSAVKTGDASSLSAASSAAKTAVKDAVDQQSYNAGVIPNVMKMIMQIFGITADDLAELPGELPDEFIPDTPSDDDDGSGYDKPNDNENNNGSSVGDGEVDYASKDLVYWPPEKKYLPYAEVLSKVEAAISDEMNGKDIDPELKKAVNDFLASLQTKS